MAPISVGILLLLSIQFLSSSATEPPVDDPVSECAKAYKTFIACVLQCYRDSFGANCTGDDPCTEKPHISFSHPWQLFGTNKVMESFYCITKGCNSQVPKYLCDSSPMNNCDDNGNDTNEQTDYRRTNQKINAQSSTGSQSIAQTYNGKANNGNDEGKDEEEDCNEDEDYYEDYDEDEDEDCKEDEDEDCNENEDEDKGDDCNENENEDEDEDYYEDYDEEDEDCNEDEDEDKGDDCNEDENEDDCYDGSIDDNDECDCTDNDDDGGDHDNDDECKDAGDNDNCEYYCDCNDNDDDGGDHDDECKDAGDNDNCEYYCENYGVNDNCDNQAAATANSQGNNQRSQTGTKASSGGGSSANSGGDSSANSESSSNANSGSGSSASSGSGSYANSQSSSYANSGGGSSANSGSGSSANSESSSYANSGSGSYATSGDSYANYRDGSYANSEDVLSSKNDDLSTSNGKISYNTLYLPWVNMDNRGAQPSIPTHSGGDGTYFGQYLHPNYQQITYPQNWPGTGGSSSQNAHNLNSRIIPNTLLFLDPAKGLNSNNRYNKSPFNLNSAPSYPKMPNNQNDELQGKNTESTGQMVYPLNQPNYDQSNNHQGGFRLVRYPYPYSQESPQSNPQHHLFQGESIPAASAFRSMTGNDQSSYGLQSYGAHSDVLPSSNEFSRANNPTWVQQPGQYPIAGGNIESNKQWLQKGTSNPQQNT